MNILKLLEIKCPVDEIKGIDDVIALFDFLELKCQWTPPYIDIAPTLLKQRKEWEAMIEDLITDLLHTCEICIEFSVPCAPCKMHTPPLCDQWDKRIKIIESILNKSWQDIKKILESKKQPKT